MKRAGIGVIAAAVLAVATVAWAQKPDFSGTWTPDPAAAGTAGESGGGGGRRGGGGPMTVKQTADTLTIERQGRQGNTQTTTYKLDGSETEQTMGQNTFKVSAKWDGNKIVITRKGEQGESTESWSLDGGKLTIERTGARAGKTVYTKGS